jgi:hypothetical protein
MKSLLKLYQTKSVDGSWDKLKNDQKQAINLMAQFRLFKAKFMPTASRVQAGKTVGQGNQTTAEQCIGIKQ